MSDSSSGGSVQSWAVTVSVNGDQILTIGHNHLSGVENIDEYADAVENCAQHLFSFITGRTRTPSQPVEGIDNRCPKCGDLPTYQTPDGTYWDGNAHFWRVPSTPSQPAAGLAVTSTNAPSAQSPLLRDTVIKECAEVCDKHARWAEDKIEDDPASTRSQIFAGISNTANDCAAMIRDLHGASAQSPLDAVHAALFEPCESDAIDNLEGALIDIKRLSEQGKPTDQVCIRTLERVQAQLLAAHAICEGSAATSTKTVEGE